MKVTLEYWDQLCAATKEAIAGLNVKAEEKEVTLRFTAEETEIEDGRLLVTRQIGSPFGDRKKVLVYVTEHGAMFPATLSHTKKGQQRVRWKMHDPLAWVYLTGKPIEDVVRRLKLADYIVMSDAELEAYELAMQNMPTFTDEEYQQIRAYQRKRKVKLEEAIAQLFPERCLPVVGSPQNSQ